MATRITNGDDSAYTVETNLSISKEQADALYRVVDKENDTRLVQDELVQQLAEAGYNQDVIDRYANDPLFVSSVADSYRSVKRETVDPRLFQTVQQYLLNAGIIAFAEQPAPESNDNYYDNKDSLPPLPDNMIDTIID